MPPTISNQYRDGKSGFNGECHTDKGNTTTIIFIGQEIPDHSIIYFSTQKDQGMSNLTHFDLINHCPARTETHNIKKSSLNQSLNR